MKKRCEVTLVILELSIHEFVSLFSWKRVDELKKIESHSKSKFELDLGVPCMKAMFSLF